jgi:hypothetical protein
MQLLRGLPSPESLGGGPDAEEVFACEFIALAHVDWTEILTRETVQNHDGDAPVACIFRAVGIAEVRVGVPTDLYDFPWIDSILLCEGIHYAATDLVARQASSSSVKPGRASL